MAPATGASAYGPLIIDSAGDPVWFLPFTTKNIHDFRVQELDGKPVLTWWEGQFQNGLRRGRVRDPRLHLHGDQARLGRERLRRRPARVHAHAVRHGADQRLQQRQRPTSRASAGRGTGRCSRASCRRSTSRTGKLLFEWHSFDHVGLDESYLPNVAGAWDYFHLNSVDLLADGNYLISARHTSTVYKLDRATGEIVWRLGGKKSDFQIGPGTAFAYQHDARARGNGVVSIFDDGGYSTVSAIEPLARDLPHARRDRDDGDARARAPAARRAARVRDGQRAAAVRTGTCSSVGAWCRAARSSRRAATSSSTRASSPPRRRYRTYRNTVDGTPAGQPNVAVVPKGNGVDLFVSWNGATEVARWRVSRRRDGERTATTIQHGPANGLRDEDPRPEASRRGQGHRPRRAPAAELRLKACLAPIPAAAPTCAARRDRWRQAARAGRAGSRAERAESDSGRWRARSGWRREAGERLAQNSWFSPAKMAETESSAKTFMIVSASMPGDRENVRLAGVASGSIGTVSVTTMPSIGRRGTSPARCRRRRRGCA